jgi:hypothetical protein
MAPWLDELDSAGNEVCEWRSCPKETSSPVAACSAQKIGWRRLSDPADDHPDGRHPACGRSVRTPRQSSQLPRGILN